MINETETAPTVYDEVYEYCVEQDGERGGYTYFKIPIKPIPKMNLLTLIIYVFLKIFTKGKR